MMIDGMTVDDIEKQFQTIGMPIYADVSPDDFHKIVDTVQRYCANMAHRLATTPRTVLDTDKEAKALAWAHYTAVNPNETKRGYDNADHLWAIREERDRIGWRAAAKGKADE